MFLPMDKAILVLRLLVEGNSIRSTEQTTDVEKKIITQVASSSGEKCEHLLQCENQECSRERRCKLTRCVASLV